MPNFRRYYLPNATVFITCVTYKRRHYLESEEDLSLFRDTLFEVKTLHPFRLLSYAILPDHFHWLMQVTNTKSNFSKVMQSIKRNFTLNYKKAHAISTSMRLWQPRFWDQIIRTDTDLSNHFDYVHWNPVKHELVKDPADWPYSSFSFWYDRGYIPETWGIEKEPKNIQGMNLE